MTYDLASELDRARFRARCGHLEGKGAAVELTEHTFRTTSQNRYMHLLIGLVAMEVGEPVAYVKEQHFKRLCNADIFVVTKADRYAGEVETLRSTADLAKEETATAIDRFKTWGRLQGWAMPDAGETEVLRQLEVEMLRKRGWL